MKEAQPPIWTEPNEAPSAAWTPREYVWLLMVAARCGRDELAQQLRAKLRTIECEPAASR